MLLPAGEQMKQALIESVELRQGALHKGTA
jgi:hypothetical protein